MSGPKTNHCPKPRGRPPRQRSRHVADDLLGALARALDAKPHDDLTIQEIAKMAGANKAMVAYYFGNKDGLLASANRALNAEIIDRLSGLDLRDEAQPMRKLVEALAPAYARHSGILRARVTDLMRDGSSLSAHRDRRIGKAAQMIEDHLSNVLDQEESRSDLDLRFATLAIMSLLIAPFVFGDAIGKMGLTQEEMRSEEWLSFLGRLLDRGLFPPPSNPGVN